LKVPSVSDAVTLDGKVFQVCDAVTKNAWSPIIIRYNDGVTRVDVDADRNLFLESMSATCRGSFARYGGAMPCDLLARKLTKLCMRKYRATVSNWLPRPTQPGHPYIVRHNKYWQGSTDWRCFFTLYRVTTLHTMSSSLTIP